MNEVVSASQGYNMRSRAVQKPQKQKGRTLRLRPKAIAKNVQPPLRESAQQMAYVPNPEPESIEMRPSQAS
jgi:hypothetical protein